MPEVQEVFRMATQKVDQEPGALERQVTRQRRAVRNRRVGAFAMVVALVAIAVAGYALTRPDKPVVPVHGGKTSSPPVTGSANAAGSMVDLLTGKITALPTSIAKSGTYYAVSPDRTKVAYSYCCTPPVPLFVANLDGTGIRRLTAQGQDAFAAQWSPDGSLLVYQQRNAMTLQLGNLFVLDVGTGRRTRLTNFDQRHDWGWWATIPSFASDGRSILFQLPGGDPNNPTWDLWTVPVTGGKQTLVRRNAGFGGYSPDGKWLAYLSPVVNFSGGSLWITSVHAGTPRALVSNARLGWLRWSPDGTRISYTNGEWVYVLNVATGSASRVAKGDHAEWFDDHTLILGR